MNDDTELYEIVLTLDKSQLRLFYQTLAKAHKNWPGGEPGEQACLQFLRDQAWRILLESQFG